MALIRMLFVGDPYRILDDCAGLAGAGTAWMQRQARHWSFSTGAPVPWLRIGRIMDDERSIRPRLVKRDDLAGADRDLLRLAARMLNDRDPLAIDRFARSGSGEPAVRSRVSPSWTVSRATKVISSSVLV